MQPQVTAIARPGDTIAIESPTYFGLLHVLEALGLRTLELPTDAQHGAFPRVPSSEAFERRPP